MIPIVQINPKIMQCKVAYQNKKSSILKRTLGQNQNNYYYSWNSEEINEILLQEINEQFPTYYDELKNLDDTWKPKSLQGENSKSLLVLPFLPKWEIQNDKRIFTGIWDVRNQQQYDLNEKFVQKIWPQIQLLDQRIIGTLLANGSVQRSTPCIRFSLKRAQNVYWKYIYLKPFSNLPPKLHKNKDKRNGKTLYAYYFWTRSLFKDYRELFYPDGKKIVPQCVFDLLQAPEGLAEIFMDVGSFNKTYGYCMLYTDSFQRDEQEFLQQQLLKFHGLELQIHKIKHQLRLYFPKKNNPILISKLYDHLLPMFYYKLGLENELKPHEMEDTFNLLDLRELQRNLSISVQS